MRICQSQTLCFILFYTVFRHDYRQLAGMKYEVTSPPPPPRPPPPPPPPVSPTFLFLSRPSLPSRRPCSLFISSVQVALAQPLSTRGCAAKQKLLPLSPQPSHPHRAFSLVACLSRVRGEEKIPRLEWSILFSTPPLSSDYKVKEAVQKSSAQGNRITDKSEGGRDGFRYLPNHCHSLQTVAKRFHCQTIL